MEYLSSFRLTSKKHFPLLLLHCSNMVDLENNLVLLTLVTDRIDQNSNDVYNSYGFILL